MPFKNYWPLQPRQPWYALLRLHLVLSHNNPFALYQNFYRNVYIISPKIHCFHHNFQVFEIIFQQVHRIWDHRIKYLQVHNWLHLRTVQQTADFALHPSAIAFTCFALTMKVSYKTTKEYVSFQEFRGIKKISFIWRKSGFTLENTCK